MDAAFQRDESSQNKKTQILNVQRELVMLESDKKKLVAKKDALDMELRKLQRQKEQLRLHEDETHQEIKKLDNELRMLDDEISREKRKMNKIV